MLSIALSLYISMIPQYCLDQSLLFILLQFCIKYWTTGQMYIIKLFLANFSDLGNICNKTLMPLINCYRSLHCKGPNTLRIFSYVVPWKGLRHVMINFCSWCYDIPDLYRHQIKDVCTFSTGATVFWVCYPLPSVIL